MVSDIHIRRDGADFQIRDLKRETVLNVAKQKGELVINGVVIPFVKRRRHYGQPEWFALQQNVNLALDDLQDTPKMFLEAGYMCLLLTVMMPLKLRLSLYVKAEQWDDLVLAIAARRQVNQQEEKF